MEIIIFIIIVISVIWLLGMSGWGILNVFKDLFTLNFSSLKDSSYFTFLVIGMIICFVLFVSSISGVPIFSFISVFLK